MYTAVKSLQGFALFLSRGRCVTCHLGEQLSNFQFDSAGALKTLKDVVSHYSAIEKNLANYVLPDDIAIFYNGAIGYDTDKDRNSLRLLQVEGSPFISGLQLSEQDQAHLVYFLEFALTDPVFKKRMDEYDHFSSVEKKSLSRNKR